MSPPGAETAGSSRPRGRWRDPRVWLGLVLTAAAVAWALRGVDVDTVAAEFARADWGVLLGISVPAYLAAVVFRALRWRHFTDAIQPIPRETLFRAVAVGFLANNLFPLRVGELLRCWYLARETGAPTAGVVATVVLEMVVDALCVIAMALAAIWFWGGEASAWRRGVVWLLPVALLPLAVVIVLRAAPEPSLRALAWGMGWLPRSLADTLLGHAEAFTRGLGALRGGSHLVWIGVHSVGIWGVASVAPFVASFWALGIDLGGPVRELAAGGLTLAAVGIAVALPQAPGFFGVYHSACRMVLEQFGIPAETALALGTLNHAVFWLTLTGIGLFALRGRRTSVLELDRAARAEAHSSQNEVN